MKLLVTFLIFLSVMSGCSGMAGRGVFSGGSDVPREKKAESGLQPGAGNLSSVRNSEAGVAAEKIRVDVQGNLDTAQLDRL